MARPTKYPPRVRGQAVRLVFDTNHEYLGVSHAASRAVTSSPCSVTATSALKVDRGA